MSSLLRSFTPRVKLQECWFEVLWGVRLGLQGCNTQLL